MEALGKGSYANNPIPSLECLTRPLEHLGEAFKIDRDVCEDQSDFKNAAASVWPETEEASVSRCQTNTNIERQSLLTQKSLVHLQVAVSHGFLLVNMSDTSQGPPKEPWGGYCGVTLLKFSDDGKTEYLVNANNDHITQKV